MVPFDQTKNSTRLHHVPGNHSLFWLSFHFTCQAVLTWEEWLHIHTCLRFVDIDVINQKNSTTKLEWFWSTAVVKMMGKLLLVRQHNYHDNDVNKAIASAKHFYEIIHIESWLTTYDLKLRRLRSQFEKNVNLTSK